MSDLKPQRYKDERPAELFDEFHEYSRDRDPVFVYELVRLVTTPISLTLYRTRQIEVDNVPATGPAILAANHFSNYDHFLAGVWLRRKIRFMAKSQMFRHNRILDFIYKYGGVFPIRRGHADEAAFETVHAILARGGCVMIYCEGGRSRTGELGEPKPGVGRAALESGVPVVPVAIHGSKGIRGWRRLRFPKITIHYGEPISFDVVAEPTREQQLEAATEIFTHVREMYGEIERDGRASVIKRVREGRPAPSPRYS
ncbi:MAG: 1-acyl-sn-glycerol-3-phosphate acyltransferase [Acidobacteria bacterium]|nr:MAG: 1-acyl-sn-glycerol-3-phosphate acyltransferase [Acidobacteriota bacterium]MCL4287336.1 1-acyl-sn-glycerol-3-phosphate acyltransferase [Thermoleophilia bacterium]GIK76765.1 MAG: 1-acyl-sn-glycerol-3-phosphate acyltransferase [Actinomycetes bacterium]